jgi:hypothetical protein
MLQFFYQGKGWHLLILLNPQANTIPDHVLSITCGLYEHYLKAAEPLH